MFGIDFVPINISLHKRLEAVAAGTWYLLFLGLMPLGIITAIYSLFFTKLYPLVAVYLFWIWVVDKNVGETGGRPSDWVRSWTLFKYVVNYFPVTVKAVPGFQLDPTRNYLCCCFPHGYLPIAAGTAFCTYGSEEARALTPHHTIRATTLNQNFFIPIYRDYLLSIGICSATPKSLNWLLSTSELRNVVTLFVGGAAESIMAHENEYRLVLKNRKGYAKIALKNGAPIVPVFAFGQQRSFKIFHFPKGSVIRRAQEFLKRVTGLAFSVVYGRGFFQYNFGILPMDKPINIVVGTPIEVLKNKEPTQDDIDNLHQRFIDSLTNIFHQYKYEYEPNPEECILTIC